MGQIRTTTRLWNRQHQVSHKPLCSRGPFPPNKGERNSEEPIKRTLKIKCHADASRNTK